MICLKHKQKIFSISVNNNLEISVPFCIFKTSSTTHRCKCWRWQLQSLKQGKVKNLQNITIKRNMWLISITLKIKMTKVSGFCYMCFVLQFVGLLDMCYGVSSWTEMLPILRILIFVDFETYLSTCCWVNSCHRVGQREVCVLPMTITSRSYWPL